MRPRTYQLSEEDMDQFLAVLKNGTDPLFTHMRHFNVIYTRVSQELFKSSMGTLSAMMQAVAMFPDLRDKCQEIYDGIESVLEAQQDFLEVTELIGKDVIAINEGLVEFLNSMKETITVEL